MKELEKYFLKPGYIFVSEEPYYIQTVLGSCISVCVWDSEKKFGGMNHYIFNKVKGNERNGRFGDVSIPYMLQLMVNAGSKIHNLKSHIVGGGQNPDLGSKIGEENAEIAEKILKEKGIEIVTMDVGGQTGRKVIFNSQSGEILVHKGINIRKSDWYEYDGK